MDEPLTRLGIVRTRDLVQLYYGARMVVNVVEKFHSGGTSSAVKILKQDPRRIRYEIYFQNQGAAEANISFGSATAVDNGDAQQLFIPAKASAPIIERSFLTDFEAVTLEVWEQGPSGVQIFTRETFLTPRPADEDLIG